MKVARTGWISRFLLDWLRKQCNHPAQALTRKGGGTQGLVVLYIPGDHNDAEYQARFTPQHGLSSKKMARSTSNDAVMCSLRIKWP